MLKQFFQETPNRDRTVFWFFWIFFAFPKLFIPHSPPSQLDLLKFAAVLGIGFPFWRLLQMTRLRPVKKVVIGLEGFTILAFGSFMAGMLMSAIISTVFGIEHPRFFGPVLILFIVPGLFLAGCWLGILIDKPPVLIATYAFVVALFIWRFGITPLTGLLILVPPLVGAYFGRKRFAA